MKSQSEYQTVVSDNSKLQCLEWTRHVRRQQGDRKRFQRVTTALRNTFTLN